MRLEETVLYRIVCLLESQSSVATRGSAEPTTSRTALIPREILHLAWPNREAFRVINTAQQPMRSAEPGA
jgi:hypothetical protein